MRRVWWWHPAALLLTLDFVGLGIASYLSVVELSGGLPSCSLLRGCEAVASSPYSRLAGVPVAVFGVGLSIVLIGLAIAWWRTGSHRLFMGHYLLSLVGVVGEGYFTYLELFVIRAVCMWCALYAISLLMRFMVGFVIWWRQAAAEPS